MAAITPPIVEPLLPQCDSGTTLTMDDYDATKVANFQPTEWDYYKVCRRHCVHFFPFPSTSQTTIERIIQNHIIINSTINHNFN